MPPADTRKAGEDLLQEAGCSRKIIAHCNAVRDCAYEYAAQNPELDFSLVEQGSMLHDIGQSGPIPYTMPSAGPI